MKSNFMEIDKKPIEEIIFLVLSNQATDAEIIKFQAWLESSLQNKQTFEKIKLLWENPESILAYGKIDELTAWHNAKKRINQKVTDTRKNRFIQIIKIAAVIVLAFIIGSLSPYFFGFDPASWGKNQTNTVTEDYSVVKAPLGSKSQIKLPDGSSVWLNSGSEVRYKSTFRQGERDIYLTGEAYFDVKKIKLSHFVVHTQDIEVKVRGTRFNVKSYPEEGLIETTLEEGLVNINKVGSNQILELKPNQKAIFVKKEGKIMVSDYLPDNLEDLKPANRKEQFVVAENIDTELSTSWKNERLVFKRERFDILMIKLERWHDVNITIENDKLKEERVTGIFEIESIEQALEALKISVPFTYEINKNNIIIK